jgi:hypothetical protein
MMRAYCSTKEFSYIVRDETAEGMCTMDWSFASLEDAELFAKRFGNLGRVERI